MWLLDPGNGQMSHAPPPSATSWLFALNGGYSAGGSSHSQDSHLQGSNSTTVPGYVGLLQDLNTDAAAALGYSGHVDNPQVSSHNLGPGMTAIGDPPNNWPRTPHMNLMAFADAAAAAASKVPFFTPLMLSQMDAGHRLHAAEFDGFPMSSVPNLNSSLERTISMRTRDVMPYPRTPVSLEKNKLVPDCLPREVIDLVDDSPSDENIWEETGKSQTPIAKQAKLCVSQHVVQSSYSSSTSAKPVYPGTALPFEEFLSQQQQTETRAIVSCEEGTDQPLNAETQGKLEINGIDLNKTPQQKPKRKKHRPKVVREGKPARTPKPATPKPVNPSGKRKYVRRSKAQVSSEIPFSEPGKTALPVSSPGIESAGSFAKNIEDNPSGKRKYVWRKKVDNSSDNTPSISRGAADPDGSGGKKSVRRCLNFDSEAPDGVNGCPGSMPLFTNTAESKAQEASVHYTRALDVENSVPEVPFFLHSSTDQMPNEYIRFSGNPISHHQPSETVRTDQILDKCRKMPENPTTPPQPSRRENLKKLARKKFLGISSGPDRPQEPDTIQLDLHGTPNLLVKRAKINQILDHDAQISTNVNPLHACGGVEKLAAFYDVNCHGPYLSQGYKKQRTEHACGFAPSSASSMCMPSDDWRSHQVALDAADAFTSADAQSFMGFKKQLASEGMEAFDQTENNTGRRSEVSLKRHSATSVSSVMEVSHITNTGNQSGQNAMDHNKLFTPLQPFAGDDTQRGQNHEALARMETQVVRTKSGMKTKRGRKRKTELNNHLINTNKIDLQGQKPASFSLEYCLGQKIAKATASTSRDFREEVPYTSSISSSNSGAIVPYGDPLDEIIQKLRHLTVNVFCNSDTAEVHNAIVPYGDGMMVPYGCLFDLTKKRRPRPKVDLDPETNRIWNLLMGKVGVIGGEGTEADKEKWWEEERRVFRGRVESFIARMHLVQGDRRFSKWKGSVVDSVVGVFLTQNVSDHLSSSAFMALAARFPLKSRCNSSEPSAEERNSGIKHDDRSEVALDGTSKSKEQVSHKGLHDQSSLVIVGDNETANTNESFGSNTSGVVANYSKVECLNSKETVIGVGHDSPDTEFGTPITLTGNTGVAEAEDRWSAEDAGSSQNSVSSQNSSEIPVQVADQIGISSLSHTRVEELTIRSMWEVIDNSTSFTELLNSVLEVSGSLRDINSCMTTSITNSQDANHVKLSVPAALPLRCDPCHFNNSSSSGLVVMECLSAPSDGNIFHQDSNSVTTNANKFENMESLNEHSTGNISEVIKQKNLTANPGSLPEASTEAESCLKKQFSCPSNLQTNISETPPGESISQKCSLKFHQEEKRLFEVESTKQAVQFQLQKQNFNNQQSFPNMNNNRNPSEVSERVQLDLKDDAYTANKVSSETPKKKSKEKKVKDETERKKTYDWDSLRKEAHRGGTKKERSCDTMDSIDWEAVRCAEVNETSQTIRERGMNNLLAERIKEFLNRLVRDHGSIDLEWLREIEPDKAKDYLLSIRGLGLKSVECVRLLTLQHLAFPVDTNVGRICVRLGWVPLQPLPESLQLHLLELYPVLETIQKYLWPRLCKLDQRTLYELHYQMITFGKVFCTKSKPNCNACPMRGECKHFASAFASARLALPGPQEKSLVSTTVPIASEKNHVPILNPTHIPQIEGINNLQARAVSGNCEPIVEEPATPEPECIQIEQSAIEDAFYEDPEEIPTIKLNIEEFTQNLQNYMQANNMELQDVDMSKALVAINPEAASIPMPKLKNASRLRTEHHVYELPDSHPLLEGLDPREPDDPSSYLLAIWTPGETAQSTEPPQASCNSQETGAFCNMATCFSCNSRREAQAQIVRGTILIPCRTAMRGSFPLNGTYFQVNEVFADHDTSRNPIDVPREWIWNLPRRTVYFGTSVPTIFKGLTTEEIQLCFWRGFVCVRGFDWKTRAPRPLYARLHFPASKAPRHRQQEKSSPAKRTANRN